MESMIVSRTSSQSLTNQNVEHGVNNQLQESGDANNNRGIVISGRGINKPGFARDGVERVEFNSIGQAVEPDATVAKWQRYIGMEAVDHTLLAIDVFDWRHFDKKTLDEAWDRTKKKIDWTDPETQRNSSKIRYTFERKLNDRWKAFKRDLKRDWSKKYKGTENHYKCSDDRVDPIQWINLVNHWETDDAEIRAAKNKRSRGIRRMNHTTGTTTYAQLRHKYKKANGGASPSRCKMFELTHLRKDGTAIDEDADKAIRDMKNKILAITEEKRVSQQPETLTEVELNEVYADTLGKDKRGVVRGFGLGVRQEDVPVSVPLQYIRRGVRLEVEDLRTTHEVEIEQVRTKAKESEDKIREEMQKDKDATMSKIEELQLMIEKQQSLIMKLLGSSNNEVRTRTNCSLDLTTTLFKDAYKVPNLSNMEGNQEEQ